MNIPSVAEMPILLDVLSKPDVDSGAMIMEVQPAEQTCCRRRCCLIGKSIRCDEVFPHELGLVVKKGDTFLLNGITSTEPISPAEELEVVRESGSRSVLGWDIPSRVTKAYKHPWGALLIFEKAHRDSSTIPFHGYHVGILVVAN